MLDKIVPDWSSLRNRVQKSQSFAILTLTDYNSFERIINDIAKSDLIGIRQFCWTNEYPEVMKKKYPSIFIYSENMSNDEFSNTIKESITAYNAKIAVLGMDGIIKVFNSNTKAWEVLGKEIVASTTFSDMPLSDFYEAFGTYYYFA